MTNLTDLYKEADAKTNEAWANIAEDGIYKGRLAAQILSEQQYKPEDPVRQVISYVFDLINNEGESVHVSTKPCGISFTDKSRLPQIWKVKSGEELTAILAGEDGKLKDVYVECLVEVHETEKGIFPTVTKVSKITAKTEQPATKLSDWDLKVYGREPIGVELTPDYNAELAK